MSSAVPALSAGIFSLGKTPSPMRPAAKSDGKTVDGGQSVLIEGIGYTYAQVQSHWP